MTRVRIALLTLITSGVLAYLHIRALEESWYWVFSWFDILMHFLGGVCVALLIAYVLLIVRGKFVYDEFLQTAFLIGGTFVVGLLWEAFEHIFNVVFDPLQSVDTVVDLFMDTLGALVVNLGLNLSVKNKQNNIHE